MYNKKKTKICIWLTENTAICSENTEFNRDNIK